MEASGATFERMSPDEPNCGACGLFRTVRSPKMSYTGKGRLKTLICCEAPGETEDQMNRQLVGSVGKWLEGKLRLLGYNLHEDFWLTNAVNCRPITPKGTNREPTNVEIDCCRPHVANVIKELQPEHIMIFGKAACRSFFGQWFKEVEPTRWRGLHIPDRRYNAWIHPMYHPSYPQRNEKDENLLALYMLDLQHATSRLTDSFPDFPDHSTLCTSLYNFDEVISLLDHVMTFQPEYFFFDYETTGLKPFKNGHKIVTTSCAFDDGIGLIKAWSFPFQYRHHFTSLQQTQIKVKFQEIMQCKGIKKVAQNIKFENMWTNVIYETPIESRYWCTQDTSHIIDDRKKFTGLKFQAYLNFGVPPYNEHIEPYLHTVEGTEFNRVEELELEDLQEYGGLDSLFGYWLFKRQQQKIAAEVGLDRAREFFFKSQMTLMDMSMRGVRSDREYYEKERIDLHNQITSLRAKLKDSLEVRLFERTTGRQFNINKDVSDDDMRILLYSILGLEPVAYTEKGKASVAAGALEKVTLPFVKDVTLLGKLSKLNGTFIQSFWYHTEPDERIHTWFNLHIPRSYRTSSDSPNLHNSPGRDKEAKKRVRSGVYASRGHQLLFADFKAIEVCVSCMYSQDPNLIHYVENPTSDLHLDETCNIWVLPREEVVKEIRFFTKNGFVFPEFYGDYYGNAAKYMWVNALFLTTASGKVLKEHLMDLGMFSRKDTPEIQFEAFKNHMKGVEDLFWTKFGKLREWQERVITEYRKTGKVRLKHGFIRQGYQSKNQIGNTPIQGSACHLLLSLLNHVEDTFNVEKTRSQLVLQIHDEAVIDMHPSEYAYVRELLKHTAEVKLREWYDWVNVPMTLEFEGVPVDKPWAEKVEVDAEGVVTKKDHKWYGQKIMGVW